MTLFIYYVILLSIGFMFASGLFLGIKLIKLI